MKVFLMSIAFLCVCVAFGNAEEKRTQQDSDVAEYAVLAGASPFGFSGTFAHHSSEKTSWLFSFGGVPDLDFILDTVGEKYRVTSQSSWAGVFINHRPFETASWLRLVAGLGVGRIENSLTREVDGVGADQYEANYRSNPVMYFGAGFGLKPVKGFVWALDIGWLQTAGPEITKTSDDLESDRSFELRTSSFLGAVLPNVQLSLGYGF